MSFYDDASLIMIPSGVKTGKVYSQKPMDSDGQFTFTRASEATRLVDGVVTKVRTNSLLQSNDFDTTWSATSVTVTGGQADKDGGTDAWSLSKTGASGYMSQVVSVSGVLTQSLYAKAGSLNWFVMNNSGFGSSGVYFDLQNGVVGGIGAGAVTASIEAVGSGWYRCSIVLNGTSSAIRIYPADGDGDTSGTSGNVLIQSAQLEQGTVATPYIATTTVAVSEGPVANMPRLNSVAGGCPSLLLEGQRTNSYLFSEPFENEGTSGSVTYEAFNWAIGFVNCINYGDNSTLRYRYGGSVAASTEYTFSAFVIMDDLSEPVIGGQTSENDFLIVIGGSVFSVANASVNMGNNIWRISLTATTSASPSVGNSGILKYTTQSNKGFRAVGYQLEAGSYATSYIPTYGTAATRVADACSGAGTSSTFNDSEGVLYAEIEALDGYDTSFRGMSISDGTNANRIALLFANNPNTIRVQVISNNSLEVLIDKSITTTQLNKFAFLYKQNDFEFWINGVKVGTDSIGNTPIGLNSLQFNSGSGGSLFEGKTKEVIYFPTALTDTELATLTTL